MPNYVFVNKKTGEEKSEFLTISEMDEFLESNPDWDTKPASPMVTGDHIMGLQKVPGGFRDVLKKIKKSNSKGISKSTIDLHNLTEI